MKSRWKSVAAKRKEHLDELHIVLRNIMTRKSADLDVQGLEVQQLLGNCDVPVELFDRLTLLHHALMLRNTKMAQRIWQEIEQGKNG